MILLFLAPILSNFKWYRKKVGGTWYKIYDRQSDFGMASEPIEWTTEKPAPNIKIIEQEEYE